MGGLSLREITPGKACKPPPADFQDAERLSELSDADADKEKGCGCASTNPGQDPLAWLLLTLACAVVTTSRRSA